MHFKTCRKTSSSDDCERSTGKTESYRFVHRISNTLAITYVSS
jgi:hypothetical protein